MAIRLCYILMLLITLPLYATAQEPIVLQRLSGPIILDGRIDEAAWMVVDPFPAVMYRPSHGAAPSERTVFRVAYNDQYLYASAKMYDSNPEGIQATSLERDQGDMLSDWFFIYLDIFNDNETTLAFGTTPAGNRTDAVVIEGGRITMSWDTFWETATHRDSSGWSAEIRIPLSSLRFQDKEGRAVIGITLWRWIARKSEVVLFPQISSEYGPFGFNNPSQAQDVILEDVSGQRPLYIAPYVLGGMSRSYLLNDAETSYNLNDEWAREVGLDVKVGLTSNVTMDLTVNTDFAQVEADNQQVNLTRFSLFFPEKRLFFQERSSIFEFALGEQDRLYYSRRIGLHEGERVRIYGGGRVVGRVGDWDVGLLNMQTAATEDESLPSENLGVLRLRRRILNENSYVGGIFTSRLGRDGS